MNHRFRCRFGPAACLLVACAWMPGTVAAQTVEVLSLEQALAEALALNPDLAAVEARATALGEMSAQAGALPDPSLSLSIDNLPVDSFSLSQEDMTQIRISVIQALPYPGKLALRSQAEDHEAGAANAEAKERRLQLARDVKTVWWNLFYLDRALDVIARNQDLLRQLISVAETRYQVGQGSQQDILLAQLEMSRLRDRAVSIRNMQENEMVRLNALLTRPALTAIKLPGSVDEDLPLLMSADDLQERAWASRPALAAQIKRAEAARSRADLAKKDYAPDFTVGAAYGLRKGNAPDGSSRSDLGSIMFSMSLPLYAGVKQDRAVDQRKAEWMQQNHRLHDYRNQVASEVHQARSDYQRASEQVQLYRQEVIPQASQAVDAVLASYQVGKADFPSLIRSQTVLHDYETQYWKVLSAANQAMARLVAAVGEEQIHE